MVYRTKDHNTPYYWEISAESEHFCCEPGRVLPNMKYDRVNVHSEGPRVRFTYVAETDSQDRSQVVGELGVTFGADQLGGQAVTEVWLKVNDRSLTPSELGRFSWAQWFLAADTIHRTPKPSMSLPGGDTVMDRISMSRQRWAEYEMQIQAAAGHPGAGGRDPAHYERVALLYMALVEAGERAPIQRLSEQLQVKPNTVSRWVAKAREHGFLPKGRRGRPG